MTPLPATANPGFASALLPLLGTAGGFVALVAIGFVGGLGAMVMMM